MQKTLIFMLSFLFMISISAQQLMVEVFSAYNVTDYDIDNLSKDNYYPIGIRVVGGHEYVQLGLEYRQNITNPKFTLNDTPNAQVEYDESYYGALVRVNISSVPVYSIGLVLKGGAGYYNYSQSTYDLSDNRQVDEHKFDKRLGYNAGAGLSIPIYGFIHWEIGWQYNIIDRESYELSDIALPQYQANYHSIQVGLSVNFMFGNKIAECKNKRHKMKAKHGREGWYRG